MNPGAAGENNLEVFMATIEWYFTTEVFYEGLVDAMINNKEVAVTTIE